MWCKGTLTGIRSTHIQLRKNHKKFSPLRRPRNFQKSTRTFYRHAPLNNLLVYNKSKAVLLNNSLIKSKTENKLRISKRQLTNQLSQRQKVVFNKLKEDALKLPFKYRMRKSVTVRTCLITPNMFEMNRLKNEKKINREKQILLFRDKLPEILTTLQLTNGLFNKKS